MQVIIISICSSIITSIVITKILATRYFKIVDGYVKNVCEDTQKFVEEVRVKACKL